VQLRPALRLFLLAAAIGVALPSSAPATPYTLAGTYLHKLPRSANGRDYTLYVNTPASYATAPTRKYPVVYITDGYWDFSLLTWEAGNLAVDSLIPECIVVGIAYSGTNPDNGSLRQWDLTPGYDPYAGANSGHAKEFLSVIEHQFIPFVEKTYRVDRSFRVLGGSSYGGLFSMYALFERPGLFNAHIAISPALWYQNRTIAARATTYAKNHASLPARVFLTLAGDESTAIRGSTTDFARQLRAAKLQNLDLAVREIAGERHSSTKAEGYERGLRFAFANLAPSRSSVPDKGWGSRDAFLRFTTRGRVGTGAAILVTGFTIDGPETKTVLIRAAGPALAKLNVAGTLADPLLRVRDAGQKLVASNDNWGSATNLGSLRAAMALVTPAFAIGSRDAAVLVTLEPGSYTVEVEGAGKTQGIAAVDVVEVLP
jgi:predicted alpha/beta superfamily hydrolase